MTETQYPVHIDTDNNSSDFTPMKETMSPREFSAWLESAFPLGVLISDDLKLKALVDQLFDEIQSVRVKKFKSPDNTKQAIEKIINNLAFGQFMEAPIRYSRDRNYYSEHTKYGQHNITYDMVKAITEGLEHLGYIEQVNGRTFYGDRTRGRQARMWSTKKLSDLIKEYQLMTPTFFYKPEQEELIQLTDKIEVESKTKNKFGKKVKIKKIDIKYKDNKQTKQMKKDLAKYNEFVKKNLITINLNSKVKVNYQILFTIYKNLINSKLEVMEIGYTQVPTHETKTHYINSNYTQYNNKYTHTHITQMFCCDNSNYNSLDNNLIDTVGGEFIRFISEKYKAYNKEMSLAIKYKNKKLKKELYSKTTEKFDLGTIGINNLKLKLNQETLYRVFSRKSFDKGGRAYGTVIQSLPESIREYIFINGEPTVEMDYLAFHMEMLYHIKGYECEENPYSKCAGEDYKKVFKTACLVSINCKNERGAITAIQKQLKRRGIEKPDMRRPFKWIIQKIKEAHPKIEEFIYKDKGIELQNKDSHIMNAILMSLMDKNILGLPIHDSVIVAKQHEETLKETMIREYKNVMGFKPVF